MNALIGYVILAFVIALVIWIVYWFIRIAIRSPKETLAVTLPIAICIALVIKDAVTQHNRSYVPEVFQVKKVLYKSEKAEGFGPGGNETGIIVFELPGTTAKQIAQEGLNYLSALQPQGDVSDWHGSYDKWYATPVVHSEHWPRSDDRVDFVPKIQSYLLRFGLPIPLDSAVENMVDKAMQKEGNYYAYGRIGLIIVIPTLHRVVYAYSG